MNSKWDYRFLDMARLISTWSKDPSTQVGAVLVDKDRRIVSTGYNGFPQNMKDDDRLYERQLKLDLSIHAEANCLLFSKRDLTDCTIYTHPFMPCSRCAGLIINSGIKRVVSLFSDNPRWIENFKLSEKMFEEASVELVIY